MNLCYLLKVSLFTNLMIKNRAKLGKITIMQTFQTKKRVVKMFRINQIKQFKMLRNISLIEQKMLKKIMKWKEMNTKMTL